MHLTHVSLFLSLAHANCIIPPKSPHLASQRQKRDPQIASNDNDITAGPSPITINLSPEWLPAEPANFLPPPWSPVSDTDSPYPSSGVSPIDDSGRSQMVDNMLASVWKWGRCPAKRVDCSRCPGDKRCQRQTVSGTVISPVNPKNEAAGTRTPPTPSISPETTGNENCPIRQCSEVNPSDGCGPGAKCTRGYCVCDLGNKGSWHQGLGYRGTEGLSALTVYQNPGVACDAKCDTLSCAEVKQLEKGICWSRPIGDVKKFPWENGEIGPGELDTDTVHSGAVNLPSAAEMLGVDRKQDGAAGDYVAGVADMANVNEAT